MRFVDYSYSLLDAAMLRLAANQPINVRHYNALVAWLALANDALVAPDGHALRSSNEGALGELMYPTLAAPSQIGQSVMAVLAGYDRPSSNSPAWAPMINNALAGVALELSNNLRITSEHTGDARPGSEAGTNTYSVVALANEFALAAIDPTALDSNTVVHLNPSTSATIAAIRPTIDQAMHALVSNQQAQVPTILQSNQQIRWLADERRVSAQRSEITVVSMLFALLAIVVLISRSSAKKAPRTVQQSSKDRAGPIRLPGPHQPIGRVGAGPTKLA